MQIEFRAIVQSEYGAPEKVLRIAERQLFAEYLSVIKRPKMHDKHLRH
jgi:hypothetical protein